MILTYKQIQEVIDYLQGSAESHDIYNTVEMLHNVREDEVENKQQLEDELYNAIFHCNNCGWWCESCDSRESSNEEEICVDCFNEEQDQLYDDF